MTCTKCGTELPEEAKYCFACGRAVDWTPTRKKRGNGQGTAYKRGRTWTGQAPGYSYVGADEKRHFVRPTKGGFATKKEALNWASEYNGAAADKPQRLIDLWEGWSKNDMLKLSYDKQTAFKIARRRLEPIIARDIAELTLDDLQGVIAEKCSSYYTARDIKTLLSHLYKRAMAANGAQSKVTHNLSRFIVLPKLEETDAVPFTEDEVAKLWALHDAGNGFVGYILLLIYTGMMPAELLRCRRSMVDLDACEIRGAGAKTKARKQTAIVFPSFIKPVVEGLLKVRGINDEADPKIVKINKDNFYEQFYETLELAGLDNPTNKDGRHRLTPYSCRHTYGTEAVKLGAHPAVIQKMLRHSNTRMQERYTHLGSDEAHAAAEMLPQKKD